MRRDRISTRGPWEAKLGETATPALPTPAAVPVRRQRSSENAISVLGRSLKGLGCQMVRGALIVLTCFSGRRLRNFTMDFRPREALFFGDNFFKLVTIGFKFSHHPFQPKRRYPSIWSLNKISIFRVPVIDP